MKLPKLVLRSRWQPRQRKLRPRSPPRATVSLQPRPSTPRGRPPEPRPRSTARASLPKLVLPSLPLRRLLKLRPRSLPEGPALVRFLGIARAKAGS